MSKNKLPPPCTYPYCHTTISYNGKDVTADYKCEYGEEGHPDRIIEVDFWTATEVHKRTTRKLMTALEVGLKKETEQYQELMGMLDSYDDDEEWK